MPQIICIKHDYIPVRTEHEYPNQDDVGEKVHDVEILDDKMEIVFFMTDRLGRGESISNSEGG